MRNTAKMTAGQLKNLIDARLANRFGVNSTEATKEQLYEALSIEIREILAAKNRKMQSRVYGENAKKVYYLSMEFLVGRSLRNHLVNLGLEKQAEEVMEEAGIPIQKIYDCEADPGLGNGGLGRLAACYMDGLAACGYPAAGYSILYEYGIFRQKIVDGWQHEEVDNWLPSGRVWLEEHPNEAFDVRFGGTVHESWNGTYHHVTHEGGDIAIAVPYDLYVSGYGSENVTKIRLWKAQSPVFDMDSFNRGDYSTVMNRSGFAELISKVLYPNDNHMEGKLLRLRQQYFFCAASVNDIVQKHLAEYGTLENLGEKVAIHVNDTHPTLAIAELMRVMLDECGYSWDRAMEITRSVFSYTNHTVLQEALEVWDADFIKNNIPRIYQIICEIDKSLCSEFSEAYPGDFWKLTRVRIIDNGRIRMANLCIYMSHSVNGVSALHSQIIRDDFFYDFRDAETNKFTNVTNGIAYRRWLLAGNPELTELLSDTIGDGFKKDADKLKDFEKFADDKNVLERLTAIKAVKKQQLLNWAGLADIDPNSCFDVQAKRMHEYKRQHLNALNIIAQYLMLKDNPNMDFVPTTYFFAAKAAPGYYFAKQMIKLLISIGDLLKADETVRDKLSVVFLEDYRVTMSEVLMPAAEFSEQISLAGKEASGTGNMKLMLNGAVTIGTLDGANIEIRDCAGPENFILFGLTKEEVLAKQATYRPRDYYESDETVKKVIDFMSKGFAGRTFTDIVNNLLETDPYLVLADFESYRNAHKRAAELYSDKYAFARCSLMNIANSGMFSADRAVTDYAKKIWDMVPIK